MSDYIFMFNLASFVISRIFFHTKDVINSRLECIFKNPWIPESTWLHDTVFGEIFPFAAWCFAYLGKFFCIQRWFASMTVVSDTSLVIHKNMFKSILFQQRHSYNNFECSNWNNKESLMDVFVEGKTELHDFSF